VGSEDRSRILEEDGLDAMDIDELEGQGMPAGGVQPRPAVLGAEAKELLGLAELGPGHGSGEEGFHEPAEVGSLTLGPADHALGVPEGVVGELGRVVAVVRGPAAWWLGGVVVPIPTGPRKRRSSCRSRKPSL
jgi:hypothetical protein